MTTTFNKKSALLLMGTLSTFLVIYFAHVKVTPGKTTRPVTIEKFKLPLYRGISERHIYFNYAELGISKPFGGHNDPLRHRNGNNNSIFTSWTTDFNVAFKFATTDDFGNRCNGVVHIKTDVPVSRLTDVKSLHEGDVFRESEFLISETVRGCMVIPVRFNDNWQKVLYNIIHKGY